MESLVLRLFRLLAALLDSPVSLLPILNLLLALTVLEDVARRSRGDSSWLRELLGWAWWEDVIVNARWSVKQGMLETSFAMGFIKS